MRRDGWLGEAPGTAPPVVPRGWAMPESPVRGASYMCKVVFVEYLRDGEYETQLESVFL